MVLLSFLIPMVNIQVFVFFFLLWCFFSLFSIWSKWVPRPWHPRKWTALWWQVPAGELSLLPLWWRLCQNPGLGVHHLRPAGRECRLELHRPPLRRCGSLLSAIYLPLKGASDRKQTGQQHWFPKAAIAEYHQVVTLTVGVSVSRSWRLEVQGPGVSRAGSE